MNDKQLLAALNAVPPLEWEDVGGGRFRTNLPEGLVLEICREGPKTWLLFDATPELLPMAEELQSLTTTTSFSYTPHILNSVVSSAAPVQLDADSELLHVVHNHG